MGSEYEGCAGCACWILIIAVVIGAISLGIWDDHRRSTQREAGIQAMLPLVHERGLAMFERLDSDGDGILHEEELRNAVMEGGFTGKDQELLQWMYKEVKFIGHEVGRYRSGKYTYSVYGISRADLRALSSRKKK